LFDMANKLFATTPIIKAQPISHIGGEQGEPR
jgi:hypothetical protein